MGNQQVSNVIKTGKPSYKVSVFSNYSGHIHESNSAGMGNNQPEAMQQLAVTTEELSVKEGMYVQKGQNIFAVYNPNRAWALLNIFTGQAAMVKVGNKYASLPKQIRLMISEPQSVT